MEAFVSFAGAGLEAAVAMMTFRKVVRGLKATQDGEMTQ